MEKLAPPEARLCLGNRAQVWVRAAVPLWDRFPPVRIGPAAASVRLQTFPAAPPPTSLPLSAEVKPSLRPPLPSLGGGAGAAELRSSLSFICGGCLLGSAAS